MSFTIVQIGASVTIGDGVDYDETLHEIVRRLETALEDIVADLPGVSSPMVW